ncbi:MAG: hypothetical protein A2V67_00650 [Deltaproteobacteria bacterium RBG_13_61_14]|nr:MAG: hypothetical protein A2V67_00650 [Deltaproteobacteria bacterium RBG_13_61_14]
MSNNEERPGLKYVLAKLLVWAAALIVAYAALSLTKLYWGPILLAYVSPLYNFFKIISILLETTALAIFIYKIRVMEIIHVVLSFICGVVGLLFWIGTTMITLEVRAIEIKRVEPPPQSYQIFNIQIPHDVCEPSSIMKIKIDLETNLAHNEEAKLDISALGGPQQAVEKKFNAEPGKRVYNALLQGKGFTGVNIDWQGPYDPKKVKVLRAYLVCFFE